MMNEDFNNEFDFSGLKGYVTEEQMAELWSKAQIASIMMKHATKLLDDVKNDVDFYVMAARYDQN
jgi:hypothetical protein